jgi:hypothetical protein
MASEKDIKSFIEQQREAGAFDSTGSFSVDLRKARQKSELAAQDLAGAHCLYWLQACMYERPFSVRLTYDSVRINGGISIPWNDLMRVAQGREDLAEPRLKLLRRAIQACAALADGEAQLFYSHSQYGSFQLNLSSGEVQPYRSSRDERDTMGVVFKRQGTPEQRAEELRRMQSRCGFSPVMPRYENRDLTEENPDGYLGRPPCTSLWNTYTHPSYLLALRQWGPVADRTGFLVPGEDSIRSQTPLRQPGHSVFLLNRCPSCSQGRADRVVGIPLGLEGKGVVRLISQGVVVESFEYDLGVPGAWALACVDHLETDFSGFKLVRNDTFAQLLAQLKAQTADLAQEALYKLPNFQLPEPEPPPQPGLMARLLLWTFGAQTSEPNNRADDARDCQLEIRRRLARLQA